MGNCTSFSYFDQTSLQKGAKILETNGNLKTIELPVTVAELMLEEPGYIVSKVAELHRGRRIQAMKADEELQSGHLYMYFPATRSQTVITEREVTAIGSATTICKKRGGKAKSSSKVLPAGVCKWREIIKEKPKRIAIVAESDTGFPGYRLEMHKPWNPTLETISEVASEL
ncbi:PADRE domain [Dillenia turbinata]|uniref:PADRE domain n=1 Tax=Dillenia turbinata TaxID=194707 RepID=A0AAN8VWC8_9MAGN